MNYGLQYLPPNFEGGGIVQVTLICTEVRDISKLVLLGRAFRHLQHLKRFALLQVSKINF